MREMQMKKILFISGSLGLGHVGRDIEIAKELRKLRTDIDISWMAEPPASEVLEKEGEKLLPEADQLYSSNLELEKSTKEYKASHILLETEDDAKAVIAELGKGANFSDLAKKKSVGPSATHGGDLGWFKPDEMVEPFARAVEELKNGEYTKTPVKSDFGWHVILREDSREVPPPSYEQMREQLKMRVQNLQIEEYIAS